MGNAYHKALKNVEEYDPTIYFGVWCSSTDCLDRNHPGYPAEYFDGGLAMKKLDFVKGLKAEGWTYDKDGNWLCPKCLKEGE